MIFNKIHREIFADLRRKEREKHEKYVVIKRRMIRMKVERYVQAKQIRKEMMRMQVEKYWKKKIYSKAQREHRAKFYQTPQWRRRREEQLKKHPMCEICYNFKPKKFTPAKVADHVDPSWDTFEQFCNFSLQSLCYECHSTKTFFFDLPKLKKMTKIKIKNV